MTKLNESQKQISCGKLSLIKYGGWGMMSMISVGISSLVGIITNGLNIANSVKSANAESTKYKYINPSITKTNLFD